MSFELPAYGAGAAERLWVNDWIGFVGEMVAASTNCQTSTARAELAPPIASLASGLAGRGRMRA